MTEPRPAELAAVLDAVGAAVERLLAEGRSERVVVHVNPSVRQVVLILPDGTFQRFRIAAPFQSAA